MSDKAINYRYALVSYKSCIQGNKHGLVRAGVHAAAVGHGFDAGTKQLPGTHRDNFKGHFRGIKRRFSSLGLETTTRSNPAAAAENALTDSFRQGRMVKDSHFKSPSHQIRSFQPLASGRGGSITGSVTRPLWATGTGRLQRTTAATQEEAVSGKVATTKASVRQAFSAA